MRTLVATLCLAAVLAAGCAAPPAATGGATFSVLTYNVNYAAPRPDLAVAAVAEADADVVCLQETNPQWERVVRQSLGDRYPHVHFHHKPAAGGIALLSKWPVSDVTFYRADAGWFPACIATVDMAAGPVQVVGVHLRPPVSDRGSFVSGYFTTRAVRREEIKELHAVAREQRAPPDHVGAAVYSAFSVERRRSHAQRSGGPDRASKCAGLQLWSPLPSAGEG